MKLLLQHSPFLGAPLTTPRLMNAVNLSLVPVLAAATWFFGVAALLVVGAAASGALLAEWALPPRKATLRDGSAALTGVLLGLTLPPAFPLWMAFLGGVVAILLGKWIWGGLGGNRFNPALVGRAFLQAAFPSAIATWTAPGSAASVAVPSSTFALPFATAEVDVMSGATPLAQMKFEHTAPAWTDLLWGSTSGSLGETSAVVLLLCGLYLAARRIIDWRIPLAMILSVAAFAAVLHAVDPARYPTPVAMVLSGGLLLGAVFMATDPVTSPTTPRGAWIFGAGIGALVVLIRVWGGLPEGVMYAILLMNAASPLLERVTQPTPFGRRRSSP